MASPAAFVRPGVIIPTLTAAANLRINAGTATDRSRLRESEHTILKMLVRFYETDCGIGIVDQSRLLPSSSPTITQSVPIIRF